MSNYRMENVKTHTLLLTDDEMNAMKHGHVEKIRLSGGDFIEIRRTNGSD